MLYTNLLKSILFVTALAIAATDVDQLCPGEFADGGKDTAVLLPLVWGQTGPKGMVISCEATTFVIPIQMAPSCSGHILLHAMGEAVVRVHHTRYRLLVQVGLLHHGKCTLDLCSQWYGY